MKRRFRDETRTLTNILGTNDTFCVRNETERHTEQRRHRAGGGSTSRQPGECRPTGSPAGMPGAGVTRRKQLSSVAHGNRTSDVPPAHGDTPASAVVSVVFSRVIQACVVIGRFSPARPQSAAQVSDGGVCVCACVCVRVRVSPLRVGSSVTRCTITIVLVR